jgi:hypothetical protein
MTLPELKSARDRHVRALAEAEARGPVHPNVAAPIGAIIAAFDKRIADISSAR